MNNASYICNKYPGTRVGARAYTNNLLLALVPIMHNPKTKRPDMTIKSGSSQLLGQWICNITLASNLANFDIPFVNDLSDEMIPLEYMFGFLM